MTVHEEKGHPDSNVVRVKVGSSFKVCTATPLIAGLLKNP